MKIHIVVCVGFLVFGSAALFGQDAGQLIQAYEEYQRTVYPLHISSHTKIKFLDSQSGNPVFGCNRSDYLFDGRRLETNVSIWLGGQEVWELDGEAANASPLLKKSFVWDGQRLYDYGESAEAGGMMIPRPAYITEDKDRAQNGVVAVMANGFDDGPLLGYIPSDTGHFIDLVKAAKQPIGVTDGEIGGKRCQVLEADTDNGSYKVWLAPEYDYAVLRLELTKRLGAKACGYVVGQEGASLDPHELEARGLTGDSLATIQRQESSFILSDVQLERVHGKWLPVACKYYTRSLFKNGRVQESWYETKRTNLDLSPDLEALRAFVPKIAEGSTVRYVGRPGVIDYLWEDGRVATDINRELLDAFDETIATAKIYISEEASTAAPPNSSAEPVEAAAVTRPGQAPLRSRYEVESAHKLSIYGLVLGGCVLGFLSVTGYVLIRRKRA